MVDFGKLLGASEEEEEEDEEEIEEGEDDDIDSIISGAEGEGEGGGAEMGDEGEGGIGAGGPQGSGGMGVAPDIRDDIDRNREDIRELEANVETMGDTVEDVDERVKDIEEDISQLLDVYEMVTAEFNPFMDEEGASPTGGGGGGEASKEDGWGMKEGEEGGEGGAFEEDSLDEVIQPPDEAEKEGGEMPDLEAPPEGEEEAQTETEAVQPEQSQQTPQEPTETEPKTPADTMQPEQSQQTPQEPTEPKTPADTMQLEQSQQTPGEKGTEAIDKLINQLESGNTYLLETTDEDFLYESFKAVVDEGTGLCITRKHPDDIKEEYDYGNMGIEFGWLSTSNEDIAVGPDELDILGLTVERFISDEGGVILLDGIGYLLSNNPDSTLIHFIQSLQDQITMGRTIFLIAVDHSDIEDENLKLLENELDVEVLEKEEFTPEPEPEASETVQRRGGSAQRSGERRQEDNLVAKVKRMMEFLDEHERSLEKKIDQVSKTSSVDVSDKVASPGVLDAIEGLEKEVKMLSNELKRLKEKQMVEKTDEVQKEVEEKTETPEEEEIEEFVEMVERGEELHEELEDIKEEIQTEEEEVSEVDEKSEPERVVGLEEEESKTEEESEAEKVEKKIVTPEQKEKEPKRDVGKEEESEVKKVKKRIVRSEEEGKTAEETETRKEESEHKEEPSKDEESAVYTENEIKLQAEVSGDIASGSGVEIQKDVSVKGSLTAEGDIVLHDRATVEGDVISRGGDVKVGKNCTINGKISGNIVVISDDSEVQVIEAEGNVDLGRNARAGKVSSGGDVKLSEKVQIEKGIDYGGKLIFEGSEIAIGDLVNPFGERKKKEVVKEKWASR